MTPARTNRATGRLPATMTGVVLPGARRVATVERPVPEPGYGQALVAVRASSICGSDIRAIYREHLGVGAEAYQGVIAGHEPAGEVVVVGPGCVRVAEGDRAAVYHVAGCGQCDECRRGFEVGCTDERRAAYGWQRDGGHAPYLLAEERSLVLLPDSLSWVDGALVACGFATAYSGLLRLGLSGRDRLLVTGLGPVGLAAAMLGRAMGATWVAGTDRSPDRVRLARDLGLLDDGVVVGAGDPVPGLRARAGGFSASLDASGAAAGRSVALRALDSWGRCALVGEGGRLEVDASEALIHQQVTVHGSWVGSIRQMEDLVGHLDRWGVHPEATVTHRFGLDEAVEAYRVADGGTAGKVCLHP